MPPTVGTEAPDFEALLCDGETFRATRRTDVDGDRGTVLVFDAFVFSAIARNWWRRYERRGWTDFDDVTVFGVVRDGPYAVNAFLRRLESPFAIFSDLDGAVARSYDLLEQRDGMANLETPRRAVLVIDAEGTIAHAWIASDWIRPVPMSEVEAAIDEL